ncbi:MAG: hypothetical protein U1D96_05265 [Eubacteriales bacterium]|nr:hypothetical protein [Clostridia bacterium]MDZ4042889.1 hypothetical protein [Eubacteriales bacterium]
MEQAVATWINEHFDVGQVQVQEFPLLPAGQLIKDSAGGSMVVYWDIARDCVATAFPQ